MAQKQFILWDKTRLVNAYVKINYDHFGNKNPPNVKYTKMKNGILKANVNVNK